MYRLERHPIKGEPLIAGKDYDPDEAVWEDDGDEEAYEEGWDDDDEGDWEDDDLIDEDDFDDEEE